MTYLELGVSDLDRALELYSGLLGLPVVESTVDSAVLGHGPALRLVDASEPSGWDPDDRQCGIRHLGMKVADIDAWAARLRSAGVRFALDPTDAFGNVRIAFFFDPDGTYLELIQGYVQHNNLWSPALVQAEIDADRGWDGSPRLDHIAITVPDLAESLAFYRSHGFTGVGQLVQPTEPRGFLITNLRAANLTLEVFTFAIPTFAHPANPDALGFRAIGLPGLTGDRLAPGGIPLRCLA